MLVRKFIFDLNFSLNLYLIVFIVLALIPGFISIFTFTTNDAMVIFLGNLAHYTTLKFLKDLSLKYAIILISTVVLGAMTKHNFTIFLVASIISFVVLAITHKNYN